MSSLVKEDLMKRLFGPRRRRLHEFIEVEGAGAQRYYLCAAASPSSCMQVTVPSHKTVYKLWKNVELKCNPIQGFSQHPTWVLVYPRKNAGDNILLSYRHVGKVTKSKEVEICMVKHWRVDREEKYEIVEKWFLKDLEMIDGKEADTDNPYFDMHFHKVYNMEAYSCASKYTFARTLNKLNAMYLKKDFKIVNFDDTYLNDDSIWSSSNRDFLVVMKVCFYASNLLCLSLCRFS